VAPGGETCAENSTLSPQLVLAGSWVRSTTVGIGFTSWSTLFDVLGVWQASPLYTAVIEWGPTPRVEIESWAFPAASTGTGGPSGLGPSRNVTVPVAPGGETCAVNSTLSPQLVLAGSCDRSTVVGIGFTS